MLAELVDRGIRADRVYGASVGAINGAAYASQPHARGDRADGRDLAEAEGDDIFPRSALDGPWLFLQKRPAVHANTGLRTIIEAGIDFEQIEDAAIPVRAGDHLAHRRPRTLDRPRQRGRGHPGLVGHPLHLPSRHH